MTQKLALSKFMRELGNHIRASYPYLLVVTEEHDRFRTEIENLASSNLSKDTPEQGVDKIEWKIYRWTCTDRWSLKGKKLAVSAEEIPSPTADFAKIRDMESYSIFIMENFHFFLTRENPDLIQMVRDLARHCQRKNKVIIFANTTSDFPAELDAFITVMDHELPLPEDLDRSIEVILGSVAERGLNITLKSDKRYMVRESLKGMRHSDADNALAYSIITTGTLDEKVLLAEKCKAIRKSGIVEYVQSTETFEQIGGLERLKQWLGLWKIAFTDKAKTFNLAPPRGVVLLGVPGCGKTLIALAAANYFGIPLIRFDLANVYSKYVGESEQRMRQALRTVDAVAPCVLFVDEIEKGSAGAGSSHEGDGGATKRTMGEFLKWMNDRKTSVFTVFTGNNIMTIPVEFLRKGRVDEIFFVDIPNSIERRDIFVKQLVRQKLDAAKYDVSALVEASNQFTGAEIAYAISMAKLVAANRGEAPSTADVVKILKDILPEAKKNKERIEAIRAKAAELAIPASLDEKEAPSEVSTSKGTWRNIQI